MDSRKALNFARVLKLKIHGIVENMSGLECPHCGKKIDLFKSGGGKRTATDLGVPFLGSIPLDPAIVSLADEGKPFVTYEPASRAAKAIENIVDKIIEPLK
jgi:ATP-binding protein involved in chromosome partitioning